MLAAVAACDGCQPDVPIDGDTKLSEIDHDREDALCERIDERRNEEYLTGLCRFNALSKPGVCSAAVDECVAHPPAECDAELAQKGRESKCKAATVAMLERCIDQLRHQALGLYAQRTCESDTAAIRETSKHVCCLWQRLGGAPEPCAELRTNCPDVFDLPWGGLSCDCDDPASAEEPAEEEDAGVAPELIPDP